MRQLPEGMTGDVVHYGNGDAYRVAVATGTVHVAPDENESRWYVAAEAGHHGRVGHVWRSTMATAAALLPFEHEADLSAVVAERAAAVVTMAAAWGPA